MKPLLLALGVAAPLALKVAAPHVETRVPAGDARATATAVFAGGCFWSMEHPFDQLDGVLAVTVGYTGGHVRNPTYEEVSAGVTGHLESVQVNYDPAKIGYDRLLDAFWHNIDPVSPDGQFCDFGPQYRTAIFYRDSAQRRVAEESKRRLETSGRFAQPIVTMIAPVSDFYPAEEYHQHYYRKNPLRYRIYRVGCGRDRRLQQIWGPSPPAADARP
jgi:peptide-methionine (S)-S-oxide reductase